MLKMQDVPDFFAHDAEEESADRVKRTRKWQRSRERSVSFDDHQQRQHDEDLIAQDDLADFKVRRPGDGRLLELVFGFE